MNGVTRRKVILLSIIALMIPMVIWANGEAEGSSVTKSNPVVIRIGHESNPGEPIDLAVKEWKRLLEEKSNGTMKIEIFPASQLGSKNNIIDQMQAGSAVVTIADGAFYADRGVPDFGIQFAPYLFSDMDEALKLPRTDWWKEQEKKLSEKAGLQIVTANWVYGARHTMTTEPVSHVSDLEGMKIRTPTNTIQIKGFEVLGATPTPMTLSEVYTSLQQGVIEGVENPLHILYNGRFYEVAKYLALDGHVMNVASWVTGSKFYKTLNSEQQELFRSTGDEAGRFLNNIQNGLFNEYLGKLKAAGVTVTEVNLEEFRQASKAFYSLPEINSLWSRDLYKTVRAALDSVN